MNYKLYDQKYANLLVSKCLINDGKKPLVIKYSDENLHEFVKLCCEEAKRCGYKEVYAFFEDSYKIADYINNTEVENIVKNELLDKSILENNAKKEANFLFLQSLQKPVPPTKDWDRYNKMVEILSPQTRCYSINISKLLCPWCIAGYPTKYWANQIYPDLPIDEAYDKLYMNIMKMCQIDKEDPSKEWDNIHENNLEKIEKLNDLNIQRLHYYNKLGTNLKLVLPDKHIWLGGNDYDYYGNEIIVNMPSYEIFTSPVYSETEGIVYSTKPVNYNSHFDLFNLKFKNGAVCEINAANDQQHDILEYLMNYDEGLKYLGECAILENDSPVNNTNTIYNSTLFDENASCHLALGDAFASTIIGGSGMDHDELKQNGLNASSHHMDFMIGTDDLSIEADTKKGKKLIYTNGKFVI